MSLNSYVASGRTVTSVTMSSLAPTPWPKGGLGGPRVGSQRGSSGFLAKTPCPGHHRALLGGDASRPTCVLSV